MTGSSEKMDPGTLHQSLAKLAKLERDLAGIARNVEVVLDCFRRLEALRPELFMRDDGK